MKLKKTGLDRFIWLRLIYKHMILIKIYY